MSQHYNPPRLEQLCRALKDTKADKHLLLVYMGLKLDTVKQFEIENCRQEGRTFMECLEYYLKNLTKPGQEWEPIVKALKDLNDPQTAQEIQKKYIEPHESTTAATGTRTDGYDDIYTTFEPPIPSPHLPPVNPHEHYLSAEADEVIDYLEKMKTMTKTKYNEAKTRIEDNAYAIKSTLDKEHESAKVELSIYKQRVDRNSEKLDQSIQELTDHTMTQQTRVQDALDSLKRGDSTGLVAIRESSNDLAELERLTSKLEKDVDQYKKQTPKSYIGSSTKDIVTQDLQAILTVSNYTCSGLDETDYVTVNPLTEF